MGWGTSLIHEDYFNKETFKYKSEVEEALKEEREYYERTKQSILALCYMTEPQKMLQQQEDMSIMDSIKYLTEDLFKEFENSSIRIYRLEVLLLEWDSCHNEDGSPKLPPEDLNVPFIFGDFIQ